MNICITFKLFLFIVGNIKLKLLWPKDTAEIANSNSVSSDFILNWIVFIILVSFLLFVIENISHYFSALYINNLVSSINWNANVHETFHCYSQNIPHILYKFNGTYNIMSLGTPSHNLGCHVFDGTTKRVRSLFAVISWQFFW